MFETMAGRLRPLWLCTLLFAFALGGPRSALGREGEREQQEARAHYDRGIAHYNLGEFDAAIDEFKQAYALSRAPRLLFNLAQAERLAKRYDQALYSYQTYLRLAPTAENRADVEQWIAEMKARLAERKPVPVAPAPAEPIKPAASPPVGVTSPPVAVAPPASPSPAPTPIASPHVVSPGWSAASVARARHERVAGLCLGIGGLALAGAAVGLQVHASQLAGQLGRFSGSWSAAEQSIYQDGQRSQSAAIALFAVGGAAAVSGAILTALGYRAPRHFAAAPISGGAAVQLSGSF